MVEDAGTKMPYKALYGKLHHWVTHPKEYNYTEDEFDAIQQYSKKLLDILNGNIVISTPTVRSRDNIVFKSHNGGRHGRTRE